jgi:hypothetical protein
MSQPDYPLFSKKHQRSQRNLRGAYNFERTREFRLAEQWFEERRAARQEYNHIPSRPSQETITNTIIQQPPSLSKKDPPGLIKTTSRPKFCKLCSKLPNNPLSVECCKSCFCFDCFSLYADLYNRCANCKKVIQIELQEQFEGLDLKIPSYDDFDYIEPVEVEASFVSFVPEIISTPIEDNYSTPQFIEEYSEQPSSEYNQEDVVPQMGEDELNVMMMNNFQLYLQYMLLSSMFATINPNQEQ